MSDARRREVHRPVMLRETIELANLREGELHLDLTVGAGGHAEAALDATHTGRLLGLDRDADVLPIAGATLSRFGDRARLAHSSFERFEEALGDEAPASALLDLGVSSLQLDSSERGFSFRADAELDMRMDRTAPRTAAYLVNDGSSQELLHAIGELGEEPHARKIVDAIVRARRDAPIRRTRELVDLVESAVGRGPAHHHPATRTFQGLRMAVNDELGVLERTLPRLIERLAPRARLLAIAFHSGEDRVVKQAFAAAGKSGRATIVTAKPVTPGASELSRNARARSAKLRVIERI